MQEKTYVTMAVYEKTTIHLSREPSRIEKAAILFMCARYLRVKFCAVRMRNAILRNDLNSFSYHFSVRVTPIFHDHTSHHSYRGLEETKLGLTPTSNKGFFNLTTETIHKSLLMQQFIVNA